MKKPTNPEWFYACIEQNGKWLFRCVDPITGAWHRVWEVPRGEVLCIPSSFGPIKVYWPVIMDEIGTISSMAVCLKAMPYSPKPGQLTCALDTVMSMACEFIKLFC